MREYRFLVTYSFEQVLTEAPITASGLGHAIKKAKQLFAEPISVAPIRKGVDPYNPRYEITNLESEYYGNI